jgi:hypothetical protein
MATAAVTDAMMVIGYFVCVWSIRSYEKYHCTILWPTLNLSANIGLFFLVLAVANTNHSIDRT